MFQIYFSLRSVIARPICILNDLLMLPEIRGGGFGMTLLRRTEAFAEETGAVRITLQAAKTNDRVKRFYETHGWARNTAPDGYSKRLN